MEINWIKFKKKTKYKYFVVENLNANLLRRIVSDEAIVTWILHIC